MMKYQNIFFPESKFGGYTDVDGTVQFYLRINALIKPDFFVVDLGCGRGAYRDDICETRRKLRAFKGRCAKIIGVDVDPQAKTNPLVDEFRLLTSSRLPIDDLSVDLIFSDNVLEHIPDPVAYFSECARVLKPGGYLCIRTPNKFGYVALAAILIPNRLHSRVTSFSQAGRKDEDVFPTLYRCNTVGKIRSMLKKNNMDGAVYEYEAEPSYLEFSKWAYFLGCVHRKLAPSFMKLSIFVFAQKSNGKLV
jgi:SAM-dependent methyltransferase